MTPARTIVCFDIGGVLVQIRHKWHQAITAAGFVPALPEDAGLNEFRALLAYQDGAIEDEEFLSTLGTWLNMTGSEALLVHEAVIIGDYPGSLALVEDLRKANVFTCCFSNTNGLHWKSLIDPFVHPSVALLDAKFASHKLGIAKPELAAFQRVSDQLPSHSQIVFFDDMPINVEAAKSSGWAAFLIDPFTDPSRQMRGFLSEMEILPKPE